MDAVQHLRVTPAMRAAWAHRLGVDPGDDRTLYGWPAERDAFVAGWLVAHQLLGERVAQNAGNDWWPNRDDYDPNILDVDLTHTEEESHA